MKPDSLLLIANHETYAERLEKALAPDGYRMRAVLELAYPLPIHFDWTPDLAILWFPYASPDALNTLEQTIQQIRALADPPLPVLLIIDQYGSHWVEPAFQLGVTDILTRPIHPLVLRQRVRTLLRARQTEQAEERFRTIADFTYDWEYWINSEGVLIYNSPAAERITGYPRQNFLHNPCLLEEIVHPDDQERMRKHFQFERHSGEAYSLDYRILDSDGKTRWIGHACQPVQAADGRSLGRRISNRDITERKLSQQTLLRSERLAAMGRLIASLAHEINNPLQAVCANLDLVTDFPLPEKEKQHYLQVVRSEIDRLMKINNNILDFTRAHEAKLEPLVVGDVLQQALFLAASQLDAGHIETHLNIPEALPPVHVPSDQFCQVCLNLIINAADHMPQGGRLLINAHVDSEWLHLSFRDSGEGIPDEALELIFDPFYTTREDGTGLGLSISQNIIRRCGGKITARNQETGGAEFTIQMPVSSPVEEKKMETQHE